MDKKRREGRLEIRLTPQATSILMRAASVECKTVSAFILDKSLANWQPAVEVVDPEATRAALFSSHSQQASRWLNDFAPAPNSATQPRAYCGPFQ